jgi:hypothetical protein
LDLWCLPGIALRLLWVFESLFCSSFLFGMAGTLRGAKNGSFNSLLRRKHFRHALADDDARRIGIPGGDS